MTYSFESIAQLDHSKEFAQLHQKFNQFNPFKVLRVDQFEIRHSNILAWLLDPNESHQLGSFFLKKLISRLMTRTENEDKVEGIDFSPYLYAFFSDAEVYREVKTKTNRSIDLLVVVPSQKLVLVIENKFHASESEGQLKDYLDYARDCYKEYSIIPIFLTLTSDAPSESDYWILDYHDILEIITLHLELNSEAISNHIYHFLTYYTAILQEELVQDDEATDIALNVYQVNQAAINLLYFSQHDEFRKQPRYRDVFEQLDGLTQSQHVALKRIYEKKKQTIDYIFKIGNNVLREAFLSFVGVEDIPTEVYYAHVKVPSFILPDWVDFKETIGEPEKGYWLGHGLIIWFERTWNDRLKINVEVGPIPYEKRARLLTLLEEQSISFQSAAKLEGKKYTKIYTQTVIISDWANKQVIVEGMEQLYNDSELNSTFKEIALAVETMEKEEEEQEQLESTIHVVSQATGNITIDAFREFAANHGITEGQYQIKSNTVCFIVPVFRELEQIYGVTREKYWWHNSTFTFWFERLKDDRLKLVLELGPLQPEKRLAVIERLEKLGVAFAVKSKLLTAKYTRLFSESKVINNWEDEEEVRREMEELFNDPENQEILKLIDTLKEDSR